MRRSSNARAGSRRGGWRLLAALAAVWLAGTAVAAPPAPGAPVASSLKQRVLFDRLRGVIADVERRLDGVLGVAILDLTSGEEILLRPDEVFPQASSIKIAVLAELYHQDEQAARRLAGNAALGDRYVVRASDVVADSDILGRLTPGVTQLTLRDLATMMIAVSDNGATNVLIDRVGLERVNALLEAQGLHQTRLRRHMMDLRAAAEGRENVATPREMMTLLARLYRGEVLSKPAQDGFFAMLATHKDSWLPRDLPEDLRVANKPGSLEGVRNDSGVVFLKDRPYVICVMTTFLARERDGEEAISAISAAAYGTFDRLARASEYGRVVSPSNGPRR
ncbi:MAG: serine hydrolase [Proteobacteria bacterium]|nr:serine hydrolase [Pseudomonadota bacterium]